MVSVYNDADYLAVYKQKKKIFWVFMSVTAVYLAFCVAWWIYYMGLPYKHSNQGWVKACVYVVSALYIIFAFPYLGIKYSRCRRYYKMLTYVSIGLKNEEKNYFYCFEEQTLQKDNIDVCSCVFETWSKKKQEWMEREVYADAEKPLPELGEGDLVRYVAQSNILVQYEILEKHALEFEEEDEEEYDEEEYDEETPADESVEDNAQPPVEEQTKQGEENE